MKKTYITPIVTSYNINTIEIIAASITVFKNDTASAEYTDGNGNNDAREFCGSSSIWDTEW